MFRPTSAIFLFDEELLEYNIEPINYNFTSNIKNTKIQGQNQNF